MRGKTNVSDLQIKKLQNEMGGVEEKIEELKNYKSVTFSKTAWDALSDYQKCNCYVYVKSAPNYIYRVSIQSTPQFINIHNSTSNTLSLTFLINKGSNFERRYKDLEESRTTWNYTSNSVAFSDVMLCYPA